MKTGIIIDFEMEPTKGGGYNYTSLLISKILSTPSRHELVLITGHDPKKIKEQYPIPQNIRFVDLKEIERKPFFILIRVLLMICKRLRIFYSLQLEINKTKRKLYSSGFKKSGIQCLYYLPYNKHYTFDIPYFFTVWDVGHKTISFFPEISEENHFTYWNESFNAILPRASKIICESEAGKKEVEFYYRIRPERIAVAPLFSGEVINQQTTEEQTQNYLKKNGLLKDQYLYYPAQFWPHKNHIALLKSLKALNEKGIHLILVLCGSDKSNLSYIRKKVAEFKLDKQVIFLGFIKNEEIKILYQNALTLVMPTFLGPTNMPVIEAMACGCPVICSDSPGHREIAKEAALYIAPDDPDTIANAIQLVHNDKNKRAQMIESGHLVFKNSNHKIEETIKRIFEELDKFEHIRDCWE